MKIKCDCGQIAKYCYAPGYSDGSNSYTCEKCYFEFRDNMGCSCNWECIYGESAHQPEGEEGKDWRYIIHEGDEHYSKMTIQDGYWQYIDEKGRPYPCVEYDVEEEGFDNDEPDDKFWSSMRQDIL